jgi:hypothetical protein
LIKHAYVNKETIITKRGWEVDYTFYENPNDNLEFFNANDIIDDF